MMGWNTEVRFSARARICVQTGSGAHPIFYPMSTGGSFAWGSTAEHSPPSTAEVKEVWSYASTPLNVFVVWCLIKKDIRLHGTGKTLPFTSDGPGMWLEWGRE
jgi:hypothetical protein